MPYCSHLHLMSEAAVGQTGSVLPVWERLPMSTKRQKAAPSPSSNPGADRTDPRSLAAWLKLGGGGPDARGGEAENWLLEKPVLSATRLPPTSVSAHYSSMLPGFRVQDARAARF